MFVELYTRPKLTTKALLTFTQSIRLPCNLLKNASFLSTLLFHHLDRPSTRQHHSWHTDAAEAQHHKQHVLHSDAALQRPVHHCSHDKLWNVSRMVLFDLSLPTRGTIWACVGLYILSFFRQLTQFKFSCFIHNSRGNIEQSWLQNLGCLVLLLWGVIQLCGRLKAKPTDQFSDLTLTPSSYLEYHTVPTGPDHSSVGILSTVCAAVACLIGPWGP